MISAVSNSGAASPMQAVGSVSKSPLQEHIKEIAKPGGAPKPPTVPMSAPKPASTDTLAALNSLAASSPEMTRLTAHLTYANQPQAMKAYAAAASMLG
ncbi:MAG: hypothetical protein HPY45_14545 [Anaerolineae bacterium]|nr:hypothetical protein [Anaerolineae bacterium]